MLHLNKNISDEIIFFHFITLFHNKNKYREATSYKN